MSTSRDKESRTLLMAVWWNPLSFNLESKANFPVTLEYFFDGTKDIDYLIYHTRSGNGNFGKLDIYTATEDAPEYTKYGSFDFKMQNASSRVVFAQSLKKATKIKFEVHSGLGDFVSCDEWSSIKRIRIRNLTHNCWAFLQI